MILLILITWGLISIFGGAIASSEVNDFEDLYDLVIKDRYSDKNAFGYFYTTIGIIYCAPAIIIASILILIRNICFFIHDLGIK